MMSEQCNISLKIKSTSGKGSFAKSHAESNSGVQSLDVWNQNVFRTSLILPDSKNTKKNK